MIRSVPNAGRLSLRCISRPITECKIHCQYNVTYEAPTNSHTPIPLNNRYQNIRRRSTTTIASPAPCSTTSYRWFASQTPIPSTIEPSSPSSTNLQTNDLSGRGALVIGGSSSLGMEIAATLQRRGARVAITSRTFERARKAATSIHESIVPIVCDVRESAMVDCMIDEAHAALDQRLDIVVFAAGVNQDALILRVKDDAIQSQLQTNLVGAIYVSRASARKMIHGLRTYSKAPPGGKLIFISSIIGVQGNVGQSVYAASKAGLHGLTLSLSKELKSRHVMVNCIAPGFIDSGMTKKLSPGTKAALIAQTPAGTITTVEEVAQKVAFLCSQEGEQITGQIIQI